VLQVDRVDVPLAELLERDAPEHGLRTGDLGAVVHVSAPEMFDVEFVRVSGGTQALVRLTRSDIRPIEDSDLPAVRTVLPAGAA
jgi:hypothetical protein